MKNLSFEWDEIKSGSNLLKHKVSFKEVETVFEDPEALVIYDPDHSYEEDHFIILGMAKPLRVLVVCHCYRSDNEIIRIISAREANRKEREIYGRRRR